MVILLLASHGSLSQHMQLVLLYIVFGSVVFDNAVVEIVYLVVQSNVQALLSLFCHVKFWSVIHVVQCRNEFLVLHFY